MAVSFRLLGAIGIQNALMRTTLPGAVQTTVMTGNVTQLTIDALSVATRRGDEVVRAHIRAGWPAVVAFALGSAADALSYLWVRFDC